MQKRYKSLTDPYHQAGEEHVFLSYGINGSLRKREVIQPQQHTEYYLFNSQGNLKTYSDDVMSFAYYGYNAANTRTYKISLYNTNLWINGQQQPLNLQWQNAMFYPNTYLNFDAFGNYTKHYYNGTERIASRLGDNTTTIALNSNMLEDRKLQVEDLFKEDIQDLISETPQVDMPPMLDVLNLQPTGTPNDIYYYHPNHLGSTSFVTDQNQTITQGFLYAPFGEITTEYNINFGNNVIPKYSFNAKELDEETGMYYYEARYYAPPTFTSRDPLFEKYFWMTPYAYCANNPVKYVDPDGRKNLPALLFAKNNMIGNVKSVPEGDITYGSWYGYNYNFYKDIPQYNRLTTTVPEYASCFEAVWHAYMNSGEEIKSYLQTGFSDKNNSFLGRYNAISWFKEGNNLPLNENGLSRSFETDIMNGEVGDIVFMTGHAAMLASPPEVLENGNAKLNVYSTTSSGFKEQNIIFSPNGKSKTDGWSGFEGYGQLHGTDLLNDNNK